MTRQKPDDNGASDEGTRAPGAEHGGPSEVTWEEGRGRQPYANQGDEEAGPVGGGDEFEAGDRGELSGRTQEQLDEVTKKP